MNGYSLAAICEIVTGRNAYFVKLAAVMNGNRSAGLEDRKRENFKKPLMEKTRKSRAVNDTILFCVSVHNNEQTNYRVFIGLAFENRISPFRPLKATPLHEI